MNCKANENGQPCRQDAKCANGYCPLHSAMLAPKQAKP